MDWLEEYRRKLVTPEEAVGVVKSGDRVAIPLGQTPLALCEALVGRKNELQDVEILTCYPTYDPGWLMPGMEGSIRVNAEVINSAATRPPLNAGFIDYTPNLFSIGFKPIDDGRDDAKSIDVCIVMLSPPDKNGYCTFGPQLWTKRSYARRAMKVIAQVDPSLIRVGGDSYFHLSQVDYFVEAEIPRGQRNPPVIEDYHRQIARHVSTLIRDGDTIQIGFGATAAPLVLCGAYDKANDLGLHSELVVPGTIRLIMRGIINGKRKTINVGKHVATGWSGDAEEMAFLDGNPTFEARDAEYVVNIKTISAHDNMLTVNTGISVDLVGQVCSESIGLRMYSGTGGQPEFAIGAALSKGGHSVIVLPSTAADGSISRIVPYISDGSYVTIPRSFTDTVVTEYGIAKLLGKSQRERAEALIEIAHPKFRDGLKSAAREMFWSYT